MNNSGVYLITNNITGRSYVGSAKNITRRWKAHRFALKNGAHHSVKLQRSWNKYGESQFIFSIVEIVNDVERLVDIEQSWIEKMDSFVSGYNSNPIAGSSLGRKLSEETKKKISIIHKGKVRTAEDRAKQSQSTRGIPLSPEHRKKLSDANKSRGARQTEIRLKREAEEELLMLQHEEVKKTMRDNLSLMSPIPNCTCLKCGKLFYTYPPEIIRGGGKYCSQKCYRLSRTKDVCSRTCRKCGEIFNFQKGLEFRRCPTCAKRKNAQDAQCSAYGNENGVRWTEAAQWDERMAA